QCVQSARGAGGGQRPEDLERAGNGVWSAPGADRPMEAAARGRESGGLSRRRQPQRAGAGSAHRATLSADRPAQSGGGLAAEKGEQPLAVKRTLMEPEHPQLSVARQCALLGLARSSWYYTPRGESAENLELMCRLDEQYTRTPFYGIRRMTAWLHHEGYAVNHKRVGRLLRLMGLEALYPKPRLSVPGAGDGAKRYPYLLRGRAITAANEVWSTDITYVRM